MNPYFPEGFTLTRERAEQIRKWRVDEGYTWRAISREAYDTWGGTWDPPINQIIGMAICTEAALLLGEDPSDDPWN